jgi:manganese transport protein
MARSKIEPSLRDVHGSVAPGRGAGFWRRLLSFTGPGFMVSVGYMDPGNWATDLGAGASYGYQLIWVILLSNLLAILLQTLSARLGIVARRDLAQACREHYPRAIVPVLWVLCEVAIAACDLAEVLGSAIALHLLFGIPILWGVLITAFDVIVLLSLQSYGIRRIEAVVLTLVATIGICFTVEMFLSRPPFMELVKGFVPSSLSGQKLYLAIGILGATVMPHNLYLHSALVQSRAVERTRDGLKEAAGFNFIDSLVALNGAFLVNAAILVLAASTFYKAGHHDIASLQDAHALLKPLLGSTLAPVLFAVALLAAGQSSTITGTMAGQVVMEGFVSLRLRPWLRRVITRLMAIVPAVLVILWRGDAGVDDLLILSQVILSLQLSFAVIPLIHFTSDRRLMGIFATPWWGRVLAWLTAGLIVSLNLKLVLETLSRGLQSGHWAARFLLLPAVALLGPLLAWMIFEPLWRKFQEQRRQVVPTPALPVIEASLAQKYRRVAVALEAAPGDADILSGVIPLIRASGAEVILIHVVESAAARFIGDEVNDAEARHDKEYLRRVALRLTQAGLQCKTRLGAGDPSEEIARIAEEEQSDLIVTGAHGHRFLGDLFHGSTVDDLHHLTTIPLLTIRIAPLSRAEQKVKRAALRY